MNLVIFYTVLLLSILHLIVSTCPGGYEQKYYGTNAGMLLILLLLLL